MLIKYPWNQNVGHIMKQRNWCLALLENNTLLGKNHTIQTVQEGRFEKVSEVVFYFWRLNSWTRRQYLPYWQRHTLILFIIFLSSQYLFLELRTSITQKYFVVFTPDSVVCVCVSGRWAFVRLGSMSADAFASLSVISGRQWTGK